MTWYVGIGLTLFLLVLNALFVGSEFALLAARRTQIEPRAQAGSRPAKMALSAMENLSLVMAAAQLGITACTVVLGAVSEPAIAYMIEPGLDRLGVPYAFQHPIAFAIALTLVVYAHVVFAEMVPKNLALVGPERAALILGPFMFVVVRLLKPFVVALNVIANTVIRMCRVEPRDEVATAFSHDEVAGLVEESRREGLLDEDEYGLVSGALDFHQGTVAQVLLPIDDIVTLDPASRPGDVERLCAETGFSRFPMTDVDGDLVGYVHVKDVLERDAAVREEPVAKKWVYQLVTVRDTASLFDALRQMQSAGVHLARVIAPVVDAADEEYAVVGVIMLEDVLEELIGEVYDLDPARR